MASRPPIQSDNKAGSPLSPPLPPPTTSHVPKPQPSTSSALSYGANATDSTHKQIQTAMEFKEQRDTLLNQYQELGEEAFPRRPEVEQLLDKCHTFRIPYRKMWPRNCTETVIKAAEEGCHPIHTTLYLDVCIPKVLLLASERTQLELWVDIHGGGGFTGSPSFIPWMFKGILEHQLQTVNTIRVSPSYPLMFESNGEEIVENNSYIWAALFNKLQDALHEKNPNLNIAWERTNLISVSFGCGLALDMVFRKLTKKPASLRIVKMFCQSSLSGTYDREPGLYMGRFIPQEEADACSREILDLKNNAHLMPRRAGKDPPLGMFGAYATSVSQVAGARWTDHWGYPTFVELVRDGTCPNNGILVLFVHGEADQMVKLKDVEEQVKSLRAKFPSVDVRLHIKSGRGHADDYSDDDNEFASFLAL